MDVVGGGRLVTCLDQPRLFVAVSVWLCSEKIGMTQAEGTNRFPRMSDSFWWRQRGKKYCMRLLIIISSLSDVGEQMHTNQGIRVVTFDISKWKLHYTKRVLPHNISRSATLRKYSCTFAPNLDIPAAESLTAFISTLSIPNEMNRINTFHPCWRDTATLHCRITICLSYEIYFSE